MSIYNSLLAIQYFNSWEGNLLADIIEIAIAKIIHRQPLQVAFL